VGAEAACSTNPVSRHTGIAITLLVVLATPDQLRPDAPAPLAQAVQAPAELRMQWPNPNTVQLAALGTRQWVANRLERTVRHSGKRPN